MEENFSLYNGDCLDVLKTLEDNSIDSCVTDPPYGYSFMGRNWDYDVPSKEIWEEVLRVLKPGGHLLSFGGSRTYHRMTCAIEDAGFEIRDQVMWIYGQGFPKSHDISKAIDKNLGVERSKVRAPVDEVRNPKSINSGHGIDGGDRPWMMAAREKGYHEAVSDEAVSDEAILWEGWGTALKPAHEPICLARKPISEKTVAKNVLKWGTSALNIDECMVKTVDEAPGRWPANVCHDGSDEVVAGFPDTKSGALTANQQINGGFKGTKNCYGTAERGGSNEYSANSGSAARFYYSPKASKSDREEGLENFLKKFQAGAEFRPNHMEKALEGETGNPYGRWDPRKNNHPTVKPTNLMKYLIKLVTQKGGTVLDPFMGSGTTGKACGFEDYKFVGIEMDKDYFEIAKARIEHAYKKKTVGLEKFFK